MEETSTSVVGNKHPAGCNPRSDRATKLSSYSTGVMADGC